VPPPPPADGRWQSAPTIRRHSRRRPF